MTFSTKEQALDALEEARAEWLAAARAWARRYVQPWGITIEEVRRFGPSLPADVDPRVCGAVFRGAEWVFCGYRTGTRRTSHHRPVAVYKLAGAE